MSNVIHLSKSRQVLSLDSEGAKRITCPPQLAAGSAAAKQQHGEAPQNCQLPRNCLKSGGPQAPSKKSVTVRFVSGLDKLKIGFFVSFTDDSRSNLFKLLENSKKAAQESDSPVVVDFGRDWIWNCHSTGKKGGYGYHVSRDDLHLYFSRRVSLNQTPNLYLEIGSKSCWRPGHLLVVGQMIDFINFLGGCIEKHKISETHLCVDAVNQSISELPVSDRRNWVARVRQVGNFQKYESLQGVTSVALTDFAVRDESDIVESGVTMGGKSSIHSVIYDKIYEGRRHPSKQSVFLDCWGESDWDSLCVTRCEFHLRREILKQFKIDSYDELINNLDNLWVYLTEEWQRLVIPPDRENRHQDRAVVHPFWLQIQQVKFGDGWSADLVREQPPPSGDVDQMIQAAAGYAMSLATIARIDTGDVRACWSVFASRVEKYLHELRFDVPPKKIHCKTGETYSVSSFEFRMISRKARLWPHFQGLVIPKLNPTIGIH